jgi:hypothetical protein
VGEAKRKKAWLKTAGRFLEAAFQAMQKNDGKAFVKSRRSYEDAGGDFCDDFLADYCRRTNIPSLHAVSLATPIIPLMFYGSNDCAIEYFMDLVSRPLPLTDEYEQSLIVLSIPLPSDTPPDMAESYQYFYALALRLLATIEMSLDAGKGFDSHVVALVGLANQNHSSAFQQAKAQVLSHKENTEIFIAGGRETGQEEFPKPPKKDWGL